MEMTVNFPGGSRVDAHFDTFTVMTDQPVSQGGDGSAPTPFELFLASLCTCAGIYVLGFCKQRNLPTEGIRIVERTHQDPATKLISNIELEIQVPPAFPEQYYDALIRTAQLCKVKKHLENPPSFQIFTKVVDSSGS
jgi:ribosomal protein S12 methylthiotransferase accessory factor